MALVNNGNIEYDNHILFAGDGHEITSNDHTVNVTQDGINFDLSVQSSIDIAKEYTDEKVEELDNTLARVAKSGDYNDLLDKPEIPSIEGLATKEELVEVESKIPSIEGLATKEELVEVEGKIPSLEGYATEEYVNQGLEGKQDKGDYATKDEIPTDFYTKNEADTRFALKGDVPTDVYTKAESNNLFQPKGDYALKSEIPSTDTFATKEELEEVEGKIPSIEGLATKEELEEVEGKIPSIEGLASESYVDGMIQEVEGKIPSLEGYATEQYVGQEIEVFDSTLASVAKSGDYNDLSNKPDIPSIEGLASESYVDGKIQEVEGKIPSLEGYATEEYVNQGLEGKQDKGDYATKDEIPSIEGLASEAYVDGKVQEVEGMIPDVSNLATKDELVEVESKIPSIEGLASESYVDGKVEEVEGKIPSLEGYATEQYVSDIVSNNPTFGEMYTAISQEIEAFDNTLASVSKSGSYNDLTDTPEIPSLNGYATEQYVSQEIRYLDNSLASVAKSGDYNDLSNKPDIPSIEGLASEGYVDGRIQEVESEIPSIEGLATTEEVTTAKNEAISSSVNAASQMMSSLSTSMQQAMDGKDNQVKSELNAKINAKQDTLVSGTSIKTINGESVLGEGNIEIKGSEGGLLSVSHDDTLKGNGTNDDPLGVDGIELTQDQINALNSGITSDKVLHIAEDSWVRGEINSAMSTKQDTLIPRVNIKTINGESVLGEGNLVIQGGGTIDYCTNAMVDALWGTTPPTPPTQDLYVQMLLEGGRGQATFIDWEDASKPRYFGVLTSSISYEVPNFVIHDMSWTTRVNVNSATKDSFETLEFDGMTFYKVYHADYTLPWGNWQIDGYQGGTDIWLLMDSNTNQPYEGEESGDDGQDGYKYTMKLYVDSEIWNNKDFKLNTICFNRSHEGGGVIEYKNINGEWEEATLLEQWNDSTDDTTFVYSELVTLGKSDYNMIELKATLSYPLEDSATIIYANGDENGESYTNGLYLVEIYDSDGAKVKDCYATNTLEPKYWLGF